MKIDNTSQCEGCIFCTLDESNRAKILVTCDRDDKTRIFGQYIDCEHFEKRSEDDAN